MRNTSIELDLVKKWGRKLPEHVAEELPWEILGALVDGLSDDTMLPRDVLTDAIQRRDVAGLFAIADNLEVTSYTSPDLLLQDRLVVQLFSKFDFPNSPFNKREKAMIRFYEAEFSCLMANRRMRIAPTDEVNEVIHLAIREIDRALGKFNVDEMSRFARFGPGSTLCVSGAYTTEYYKLSETCPTVSSGCFSYAEALANYDPQWCGYLAGIHPLDIIGPFSLTREGAEIDFRITDHNKVTFVPKNAKTERSIAIEPYFNVYFQLGVGAMIRKRLYRRFGINLDTQKVNQDCARRGSLDGSLATIDFSMASDTIAREVVRTLLPKEWYDHLDRLRSHNYLLGGEISPYQKFSSMGNGFTFELETLIFAGVARACHMHLQLPLDDIAVYGDDVIIASAAAGLFQRTCAFLGFTVNDEKSFVEGLFRESCGEDFLRGVRVRPVFCKELRTVRDVVSLANRLSELGRSVGVGSRLDMLLRRSLCVLHRRIPRDVRRLVVGPPSESYDTHLHVTSLDVLSRSEMVKWDRNLWCWVYPQIRFVPKARRRRNAAFALYLNRTLASRPRAIAVERKVLGGLPPGLLRYGTTADDYCREAVPREITGRKVGDLKFGRTLGWSPGIEATLK